MRQLTLILFLISAAFATNAQRTTRSRLKPKPRTTTEIAADTVFSAADSATITFAGYEKTLRATKESFFVTNSSDSTINRLILTIIYKDMSGRQLDSRKVDIPVDLQPHETRRVDLSSWDKQKVMYYHRSPKPRSTQATPYKVSITLVAALRER